MELIEYAGLCLIRGRRLCGFGLHSEPALPRSCSPNLPPRYAKNSILISGSHSENRLGLVCEKTLYAAKLYPFHAEALRSSDGRNSEEKRSTPTRPRTTALSCVRHMPPDTATLGRYSTFRCFESRSTEESLPCKGYTVSWGCLPALEAWVIRRVGPRQENGALGVSRRESGWTGKGWCGACSEHSEPAPIWSDLIWSDLMFPMCGAR